MPKHSLARKQLLINENDECEVDLAIRTLVRVADITAIAEAGGGDDAIGHDACRHLTERDIAGMVVPKVSVVMLRLGHTLEDRVVLIERLVIEG